MTAARRRGACPSLAAPMASGDGLLVRLGLAEGLTAAQLAGLGRAAVRFGNGVVEVTARGSLQLRGLGPGTLAGLGAALADCGIAVPDGPPVLTGPLAGLDPAEVADPRPLARALRGHVRPLPPKVSVVVDGGGALHLDAVAADLRLRAVPEGWLVAAGGTAATAVPLGVLNAAAAVAAGRALLDRLSATGQRARDLTLEPGADVPALRAPAVPVGGFELRDGLGRGVALPFGQTDGGILERLAEAAGAVRLHPAPGRALIATGLTAASERRFLAAAGRLGLVTAPEDPRLGISACAGAPACASATLATKTIAARLAARSVAPGVRLHLSGCPKRCAQPLPPAITLLGTPDGPVVTGEGVAVPVDLRALLLAQAEMHHP